MTQQISLKDVTDAEDTCLLLKYVMYLVLASMLHTWEGKTTAASKLGRPYDPLLLIYILIWQFPKFKIKHNLKPAHDYTLYYGFLILI